MKKSKARHKHGIESVKALYGRLFVLPWVIGFILFFLIPLLSTVNYSLGQLTPSANGLDFQFQGLTNYIQLFTVDSKFLPELSISFSNMLYQVPLILSFSVFFALILNQEFKGRVLARAILFLPVIVTSGVVIYILKTDVNATSMMGGSQGQGFISVTVLTNILQNLGLSSQIINGINTAMSNIVELVWKCGVQILLFLGGLQSTPKSFYEAASVEGATGWEKFWKITFPMLTPILLTGVVFTIVDSFTYYSNNIMLNCITPAFTSLRYSYACAMSLTYSLSVLMVLGLIFVIFGRKVNYIEK